MNRRHVRHALLALLLAACRDPASPPPVAAAPTSAPVVLPAPPPSSPSLSPSDGAEEASPAERYFGNAELVDQSGARHRFFVDLLKGHVVVINSFFSSCTGSCPVMAGTLAKLQQHLGDRLGREVVILSVSVDPVHDTPERLKEWAGHYSARPGWYLLGGDPAQVKAVLGRLGQAVQAPDDHSPIMLIGNVPTGLWKKVFGLGKADEVIRIVDGVLADRGAATAPGAAH